MGFKTALIALLFTAGVWAQDAKKDPEQEKKKEDEAKAAIADFKKELKTCKKDSDFAAAISNLGKVKHSKVLTELKQWLAKPEELAIAAAEQIGQYTHDAGAAETLMVFAGARKEPKAIEQGLRSAADVGYKPIASRYFTYFKNPNHDIAAESVASCGRLKSREAVEPLISLLRELDGIHKETGGTGAVPGVLPTPGLGDEQIKRKLQVTPAANNALAAITGENFQTSKEWDAWWRKNKATFKERE